MSGFTTELDVRWDAKTRDWVLQAPLVWQGLEGDVVRVPKGFRTDFASTPRIFENIFPTTGAWVRAAVVHDWLCKLLNDYRRDCREYKAALRRRNAVRVRIAGYPLIPVPDVPTPPRFNALDADNVFRLIMIQEGVAPALAQFGWIGVRLGAAVNPARFKGTLATLPEVLLYLLVYLAIGLSAVALVGLLFVWLVIL